MPFERSLFHKNNSITYRTDVKTVLLCLFIYITTRQFCVIDFSLNIIKTKPFNILVHLLIILNVYYNIVVNRSSQLNVRLCLSNG